MLVIDSQVHIWLPEAPDRPWPKGREPHLPEPLSDRKLLAMMAEAGVDRAVLVPPSFEGDRIDYCLAAARQHPDRFAVMGRFPIEKPEHRDRIPGWKRQPGMLGMRFTFHRPQHRHWLTDGTADWFWPEAERAEIPIMLSAPYALPVVGAIAERHPRLRLIIDHMAVGSEDMDDAVGAAVERLLPLARHPNVFVKVSCLPRHSSEPYPFRNLHGPLRRVIDGFGPRRCFWGSDLSLLLAKCSYREGVTLFTEALGLSAEEKEWIMGRGLADCIGWTLPD